MAFLGDPSFYRKLAPDAAPEGNGTPAPEVKADPRLKEMEDRIAALQKERDEYKDNWNSAYTLIRSDGKTPEQIEQATRRAMKAAGFDDAYIGDYIEAQRGQGQKGEEDPEDEAPARGTKGGKKELEDAAAERIQRLEEELESMRAENNGNRKNYLQRMLDEQVRDLTGSPEVGKLLSRLKDSLPEDASEEQVSQRVSKVKETLSARLTRETLDRLRQRRQTNGGRWDDRWIEEEARGASKALLGEYETFLAHPSKIGRAPEANPWESHIKNKPVAPPSYKKGMTPEQAEEQVRSFAVDQLLRAAAESQQGGKTQV